MYRNPATRAFLLSELISPSTVGRSGRGTLETWKKFPWISCMRILSKERNEIGVATPASGATNGRSRQQRPSQVARYRFVWQTDTIFDRATNSCPSPAFWRPCRLRRLDFAIHLADAIKTSKLGSRKWISNCEDREERLQETVKMVLERQPRSGNSSSARARPGRQRADRLASIANLVRKSVRGAMGRTVK